jgi:hypothetical protein
VEWVCPFGGLRFPYVDIHKFYGISNRDKYVYLDGSNIFLEIIRDFLSTKFAGTTDECFDTLSALIEYYSSEKRNSLLVQLQSPDRLMLAAAEAEAVRDTRVLATLSCSVRVALPRS